MASVASLMSQGRERGFALELALFYYTLCVMLASMVAGAFCLAAYLVSKRRSMGFLAGSLMSYFFDVAFVFRDDYLARAMQGEGSDALYFIGAPLPSIVSGAFVFGFLWLSVCEFLSVRDPRPRYAPIAAFALLSLVVYLAIPEGSVQLFVFYGMRSLFAAWTLAYVAYRFVRSDSEVQEGRMRKLAPVVAILGLLAFLVLAENVTVLFVVDVPEGGLWWLPFFPERNFAENALMLAVAFFSCRKAASLLSLRSESAPVYSALHGQMARAESLDSYAHAFALTEREAEVLSLILEGKDNQNIASTLNVTPGTVKVHVHNVLKKTGMRDRKELIKDYWKRA